MKTLFKCSPFILLFFLLSNLFFISCKGKIKQEINISDSIIGISKVILPFEYEEWLNWSSNYYSDKGVENPERFPFHSMSEVGWLKDILIENKFNKEQMHCFLLIDNKKDNFHSFIIEMSNSPVGQMVLFNLNNDGTIISQLLLSEQDTTDYLKGFEMMEDMGIELYEGELFYDEVQERGIITNKKVLKNYMIQTDGSIK